jgi:hypothetical protein
MTINYLKNIPDRAGKQVMDYFAGNNLKRINDAYRPEVHKIYLHALEQFKSAGYKQGYLALYEDPSNEPERFAYAASAPMNIRYLCLLSNTLIKHENSTISDEGILCLLMHEIAHHYLRHSERKRVSNAQTEAEANRLIVQIVGLDRFCDMIKGTVSESEWTRQVIRLQQKLEERGYIVKRGVPLPHGPDYNLHNIS